MEKDKYSTLSTNETETFICFSIILSTCKKRHCLPIQKELDLKRYFQKKEKKKNQLVLYLQNSHFFKNLNLSSEKVALLFNACYSTYKSY